MNKNNILFLLTILQCIENIKIYSAGYKTASDFRWGNQKRDFNATIAQLIAIGEESCKIDDDLKKEFSNIRWDSVIGMRNVLAHNYRGVDGDLVWSTIREKLTPLKHACIQMLYSLEPDKKELEEELSSPFYKDIKYLLD